MPAPSYPRTEQEEVLLRRYREARRAGLSHDEARVLSHDSAIDIGRLRQLVAANLGREAIVAILL